MKKLRRRNAMLCLAVRGALATLAAVAAGATQAAETSDLVRELTEPTSLIEIGALYVSDSSWKFGEYNGLDQSGAYVIGNIFAYGGGGAASAFRWRIEG